MKILRNLSTEISIINKTRPQKDYNFFHVCTETFLMYYSVLCIKSMDSFFKPQYFFTNSQNLSLTQ